MYLIDSHYHFDFIIDQQARQLFLETIAREKLKIVAQTVTPSGFIKLKDNLKEMNLDKTLIPFLSLGFHPWWIESKEQADRELAIFQQNLDQSLLIGEVGLDFSANGLEKADKDLQIYVFSNVLSLIAERIDVQYVLSIHAVQSASRVLDLLESYSAKNIKAILHRFNGTSDQLTRHRDRGGYLSVHPTMLNSKKGRAYVQQIAGDHLLLESDWPDEEKNNWELNEIQKTVLELKSLLNKTVDDLSEIRNEEMRSIIFKTQSELYEGDH
ncbi:TatD family hydrolase [Facklamia sp. 7083-14-GEN3]|uniref:TatD family hydrolase n=1 Tax=Facklamia sp. 7083-14-GEN3 TaxID=2973478 RepID=UPI00215C600E|nr:TatD family hydrolase [Facklamia sp. 7083-14-GEN3]MCR8968493.1 TatD family hydrolase [Facklamia sp. 7083-14-GEN3]